MGMYTQLHLCVTLKKDTPQKVIDMLNCMLDPDVIVPPGDLPKHPIFDTCRWLFMLNCDSAYFSAETNSSLNYNGVHQEYYLNVQCNLKNYDNEIIKFVDWIYPYIDSSDKFLGYWRYEEDDLPTLIMHTPSEGKCYPLLVEGVIKNPGKELEANGAES